MEIKNNNLTTKDILNSIKLSSTNMSKLRQKFVEDVIMGAALARKLFLKNNTELKDYTKIPFTKIGNGTEHTIYDCGDSVLKVSKGLRISPTKSNRNTKNNIYEKCYFYSLESLLLDSINYLKQVNSYWYQEPLCLVGYCKEGAKYIPVYKQKKLKYTAEEFLRENNTSDNDSRVLQIKYMIPEKSQSTIKNSILNNNIFSENDLLVPLDVNLNNFMFDENDILHAVDIK